jgi:hypothetical protein
MSCNSALSAQFLPKEDAHRRQDLLALCNEAWPAALIHTMRSHSNDH